MRKSIIIIVLTAVAVLLAAGCRRIDPNGQTGDLVLHFSTGEAATKGEGDPVLNHGDSFKNLLVIVTDLNNMPITNSGNMWAYTADGEKTKETIRFENLPLGSYRVYAFANIDHQDWMKEGKKIPVPTDLDSAMQIEAAVKSLCVGGEIAGGLDVDRTLSVPTDATVPVYPASGKGMLLTGQQDVVVGVKTNIGEVKLQRPVVRFKVVVRNQSGLPIEVKSVSFSKINPSSEYLLPRDAVDGRPDLPGGLDNYHVLSNIAFPTTAIPDKQENFVETLMFENAAYAGYGIVVTVERDGVTKTLGGSYRFHFNLQWDAGSTGKVKYLTVEQTENPEHIPTEEENEATGMPSLRWLSYVDHAGDRREIPFYNTKPVKPNRQFDLTIDLADVMDIFSTTGFQIKELWYEQGWLKYWGKTSSNLVLKQLYNIQDPGDNPLNDPDITTPITFNWTPDSGQLKRVDPDTRQVTPITFMRRNQYLTVVVNVYYKVSTGHFDISVDNLSWSDDAHNSGHVFQ